jgi:hypothetical protein
MRKQLVEHPGSTLLVLQDLELPPAKEVDLQAQFSPSGRHRPLLADWPVLASYLPTLDTAAEEVADHATRGLGIQVTAYEIYERLL